MERRLDENHGKRQSVVLELMLTDDLAAIDPLQDHVHMLGAIQEHQRPSVFSGLVRLDQIGTRAPYRCQMPVDVSLQRRNQRCELDRKRGLRLVDAGYGRYRASL